MTATDFFTDTEIRTLEALYPKAEEWWLYLWHLSDAVSERNWEAGEFLRWLCPQRQRPRDATHDGEFQWWTEEAVEIVRGWRATTGYGNYLPLKFAPVCRGYVHRGSDYANRNGPWWPKPLDGLCAAMALWCEFGSETRQRLWKEWVPDAV